MERNKIKKDCYKKLFHLMLKLFRLWKANSLKKKQRQTRIRSSSNNLLLIQAIQKKNFRISLINKNRNIKKLLKL